MLLICRSILYTAVQKLLPTIFPSDLLENQNLIDSTCQGCSKFNIFEKIDNDNILNRLQVDDFWDFVNKPL